MATQQFKISKVNVDLSKYTLTSSIANDYTRNDEIEENWYRKEYVASNYTANSIVADNYYSKDYVNTNYKSNTDVDNNYFTKTYVATNYYLKNDIDTIQLDIKIAINNKGGTLTNEPFSSYATAINNLTISSGGGTSGGSSDSSDVINNFLSNTQMSFTYNGTSIARPCQLYIGTQNDTSSPVINMPNLTSLQAGSNRNSELLRYFPYTGTLHMPNITALPNYFSHCLFNIKSISEESLNTAFNKLNSLVANITSLGQYSLSYALGGESYSLLNNIATDVLTRDLVLSFPKVNTINAYGLYMCGIDNAVSNTSGTYSGTRTKGFKISLPALTSASEGYCFNALMCGILSAPNASLSIGHFNMSGNIFGSSSSSNSNGNHSTHTLDISRLYSRNGEYQKSYYVFAGWTNLQTLVIRGDYAPYTSFVYSSSDSSQRIFNQYCYCMLGKVDSTYNPNGIKGRIYVNDNQVDAYKSAPGWSEFADQIYPLSQYNEATRYDNTETYNYTDDSYVVIGSTYKNANTNYIINDAENTKVEIKFETADTTANNYCIIGGRGNINIKELYVNSFSNTGFSIKTALNKYGNNMTLSNYNQSSANILTFIGDTVLLNNTQLVLEYEYTSSATEQTVPLYIGSGAENLSGTMNYFYGAEFKFYYMKIYTRANTSSDWTLIKDYRPRVGRGIVETISDTELYNEKGQSLETRHVEYGNV